MPQSRAIALLLVGIAFAGCGGSGDEDGEKSAGETERKAVAPAPPGSVKVVAKDSGFSPSELETNAGRVTISMENKGLIMHRLGIVQTDRASGDLPVVRDQISESRIVEEIAAVAPGERGNITVQLDPGRYVIVDNLPGHYTDGMHGTLVVR